MHMAARSRRLFNLVVKRALMAIPVIWIVASLTFALVRVVPGGPFDAEKKSATANSGEYKS